MKKTLTRMFGPNRWEVTAHGRTFVKRGCRIFTAHEVLVSDELGGIHNTVEKIKTVTVH